MDFKNYKFLIFSDLHRYTNPNIKSFFKNLIFNPGFKYTFWMRTTKFMRSKKILFPFYIFCRIILKHLEYKYGISIPYNTDIGYGFYIGHFGNIVVSPYAKIGNNCNINHGVTIGAAYGGKFPGIPIIGDKVYLGPGAKIIGGITIGNNVAIGANCVVTKPIPDNAVVVGVPGKIISYKGSSHYIIRTV